MANKTDEDVDKYLHSEGLDSDREQEIGQHIGYRYDVNLVPDYDRLTPFLAKYMETMGWQDLNWLEDVHMGYEDGHPAVFDRNINGWVRVPDKINLPDNQLTVLVLVFHGVGGGQFYPGLIRQCDSNIALALGEQAISAALGLYFSSLGEVAGGFGGVSPGQACDAKGGNQCDEAC